MTMSYRDAVDADRRLVVLKLLEAAGGYRANAHLLQSALEGFGHSVSLDRVCADLDWLAEQGLLTVEHTGSVAIATLSQRGLDVAAGRSRVTGVKRPRPGG
jgi:Fe2+ or Zn2+ uptake regulation protein